MITDLLPQLTQFRVDGQSHIVLDREKCRSCPHRACVSACPANCYSFDEAAQRLDVVYETCLECGTCYVVCDREAIDWSYPRGGYGVRFRLT